MSVREADSISKPSVSTLGKRLSDSRVPPGMAYEPTPVPYVTEVKGLAEHSTSMSHTHAWVLVHVVFSTKERAHLIPDVTELCRYMTGVAKAKKLTLLAAGGTSNHVHLLIALNPVLPLSKAVQEMKGNSSRWLGERGVRFAWQEGYGAFGVSQSQKDIIADYIGRQAEHHRKWTFEQEFMTLLRKSGGSYDPRYVFG